MTQDEVLHTASSIASKGTIGSAITGSSGVIVQKYALGSQVAQWLTDNVVVISAGCTLGLFVLKVIVTILEERRKHKIFCLIESERRKNASPDTGERRRADDFNVYEDAKHKFGVEE